MEEDLIRDLYYLIHANHWQNNRGCGEAPEEEFVFVDEDCRECKSYDFCRASDRFEIKYLGKEVKPPEEVKPEGGKDGSEIPSGTGSVGEGNN